MLITPSNTLHSDVESKYSSNAGTINYLYYLGGTGALSQDVRDDVAAILP